MHDQTVREKKKGSHFGEGPLCASAPGHLRQSSEGASEALSRTGSLAAPWMRGVHRASALR
jgi:hypothetical protein